MTWKNRDARNRSTIISIEHYRAARERLIRSRATHLDQLTDKLTEKRVHSVIEVLLSGETGQLQMHQDDLQYVEDLGLIKRKPHIQISNRIYREIIPRELIAVTQDTMQIKNTSWYLATDNRLDMVKLLQSFQQFFREHSACWVERFDYKEAGPQLLMQAFLQRIINGGGRIYREYALGRKRTDLSIEWPVNPQQGFHGEVQRIIVELKIQHGSLETIIQKGLYQTAEYADKFNAQEAHLVIFNRNSNVTWQDKIWHKQHKFSGRLIGVWGM